MESNRIESSGMEMAMIRIGKKMKEKINEGRNRYKK
jgi:hypothetical protein